MSLILTATITWIPVECGGRSSPHVVGLRPTIRPQKDIAGWLRGAWDVEIKAVEPTENPKCFIAKLRLTMGETARAAMGNMVEGDLIELLEAYRVIAVGKITGITSA